MFTENNYEPGKVYRKIYTKRKNRKFLLCIIFSGSSKCSDRFKLQRMQNISTQYKHSLYNQGF